jgi:large subunit ribosomal protein L15
MQSNQLKRIHPNKKRMIVARGGKRGKTAGRGGKGQSARAGNKRRPEWRDIIKRLPKLRGRGKSSNKPFQKIPVIINLMKLEKVFSTNDQITPTILVEKGVISTQSGRIPLVKILGDGEITKAFKVSGCYLSKSAVEKINKAGGAIIPLVEKVVVKMKGSAGNKLKEVSVTKVVKPVKKAVKKEKKTEKTEKTETSEVSKTENKPETKKKSKEEVSEKKEVKIKKEASKKEEIK